MPTDRKLNWPHGPRLASRLNVRHRLAALGVVGALMCALPLWQVLRFHGQALDATQAALASLNPLTHAVALQRGLVRHRDAAAAVLRGADEREPERRQRQRVVNERLTDLELALRTHDHQRAMLEGEALRTDWTELSRRVEERSLAAADSDSAHRLLVEQALQVIDYVSLAALDLGDQAGPEVRAWLHPVVHSLPRLSARLGLLTSASPDSAEAHPREFAAVQRRLAQALDALNALQAPPSSGAALATLQARAEHYFHLQRDSAAPTALQAAASALADAEAALVDSAHQHLNAALLAHGQKLAGQRQLLLLGLALLAVLGTLLGLSLLPPRPPGGRRPAAAPAVRRFNAAETPAADVTHPALDDDLPPTQPPGRSEARHLLKRLRTPTAQAGKAADANPSHTLPPVD